MKPVYVICAFLLALGGCANRGVPPEIAAKPKQFDQCMRSVSAKPEFDSIRSKMLFPVNEAPLEAFANKDRPTPQEKVAILAWDKATDTCKHFQDEAIDYFAAHDPSYRTAFLTGRSKSKDILLALYQGKISYGEALAEKKKFSDEFGKQLTTIDKANREKSQEIELRKQAIEASRPLPPIVVAPPMPVPVVPRAPTTTNCHRFGNNLDCTTF